MSGQANAFLEALRADGPSADRGTNMDLYGWLIGSWDLMSPGFCRTASNAAGPANGTSAGRWMAARSRTLDRAAARAWAQGDAAANVNSYGTTLRTYDPRIDAWHIQWTDPVTQTYFTMIGRKEGDTIVQLGKSPDGTLIAGASPTSRPTRSVARRLSSDEWPIWRST